MRMYMIDPKKICLQHLLEEHRSCHVFAVGMKERKSITGLVKSNAIEPTSIKARHDALADEIVSRGYDHNSNLTQPEIGYLKPEEANYKIDVQAAEKLLMDSCEECVKMSKGGVIQKKVSNLTNKELTTEAKRRLLKRV